MFIRIGAKTNFFDHGFLRIRFNFLFPFLLFIEEFTVVCYSANRRRSILRNNHQVKADILGNFPRLRYTVDSRLQVVTDQTNLRETDVLVDGLYGFFLPETVGLTYG